MLKMGVGGVNIATTIGGHIETIIGIHPQLDFNTVKGDGFQQLVHRDTGAGLSLVCLLIEESYAILMFTGRSATEDP